MKKLNYTKGNPLQCSCLKNPRDGGAWWAAVYGVAQSWTRLKRLSSSSSAGCWAELLPVLVLLINFMWVMRERKKSKMIQSEQPEGIRVVTG